MRIPICNRDNALPADNWYQIEVCGVWPAGTWPDGRPRRQVIDQKAITSIVNRFRAEAAAAGANFAGLLVDLDHLSHDHENSTEAWAWLREVDVRDGQLWGRLDLTDLGEPAVRNRRVKWFSTEYDLSDLEDLGNGDVRPLRLAGLAFTNRPNNRGGRPISNRNHTTMNRPVNLSSFAVELGISPDSDEVTILSAIKNLVDRVSLMEKEKAEAEADVVMNRLGHRIPAAVHDEWRKRLIANRADTESLILRSFPERPRDEAPIFNRGTAVAPRPAESSYGGGTNRKHSAAILNRAEAIQKKEGIPFNQAWYRAQAEFNH